MPELKALARERELRGYSKVIKAELIAFLQKTRGGTPPRLHHPQENPNQRDH